MKYVKFNRQKSIDEVKDPSIYDPDTVYLTKSADEKRGIIVVGGVEYGSDVDLIENETIDSWFPNIVPADLDITASVVVPESDVIPESYVKCIDSNLEVFIYQGNSEKVVTKKPVIDFILQDKQILNINLINERGLYIKKVEIIYNSTHSGNDLVAGTSCKLKDTEFPETVIQDSDSLRVIPSFENSGTHVIECLDKTIKTIYLQNGELEKDLDIYKITVYYMKDKEIINGINL